MEISQVFQKVLKKDLFLSLTPLGSKTLNKAEFSMEIPTEVTLHFDTLEPYTEYGGGSFPISSVKQITGTLNYLQMREDVLQCEDRESWQECRMQRFYQTAAVQCACVPLGMQPLIRVT